MSPAAAIVLLGELGLRVLDLLTDPTRVSTPAELRERAELAEQQAAHAVARGQHGRADRLRRRALRWRHRATRLERR